MNCIWSCDRIELAKFQGLKILPIQGPFSLVSSRCLNPRYYNHLNSHKIPYVLRSALIDSDWSLVTWNWTKKADVKELNINFIIPQTDHCLQQQNCQNLSRDAELAETWVIFSSTLTSGYDTRRSWFENFGPFFLNLACNFQWVSWVPLQSCTW